MNIYALVPSFYGLFAALLGVLVSLQLNLPLPWLLGPLFFVATLRLCNQPVFCPRIIKVIGQAIIGISLGLFFTPDIVDIIYKYILVMILGIIFAIALSFLGTYIFMKLAHTDPKTAWFASAIGGASEMTTLADRFGARTDLVATSHSIRLFAVVTTIPFAFKFLGISGTDIGLMQYTPIDVFDMGCITLLAICTGLLFQKLRIPNAWVLGPLFLTIGLTSFQLFESGLPFGASQIGQLFIGWSIGDRYRSDFLKTAPTFAMAAFTYTGLALFFTLIIAWVVSYFSELSISTLILSLAPGGLIEMSITAKVLMLGAPLVTAFQVSRMVSVVLLTSLIYKYFFSKLK
jgi:uncharacterized protein